MREVEPQSVWVSIADAEARGISDGDLVDIHNDRGRVRIPAKVTRRIIPGTVSITEGAWYDPDADGVDHGGCANVLTSDRHSPEGSFSLNTSLVQVEPAPKIGGDQR